MADKFYADDVPSKARENTDFRRVLFTTELSQLVLMSVEPGGEIGEEIHDGTDQILVFVTGTGDAVLNDAHIPVIPGSVVVVPGGTKHNFIATGTEPLKLYTVYTPPEHEPGTVHATKADADADEHDHHH